nr:ABC transporter ATP-binding protein [Bacillus piscicola]
MKDATYKDILSIRKLTFSDKEVTSIIGESGTGKSTLLKMLNNLISPTGGSIFYNGTNLTEIDPIALRREVVMLSQTPVLFGKTVRENLEAGLHFAEKPAIADEKLTEALHYLYLDKDLDEKAEKLSGGEQQRLALARILLMKPSVSLLDEPTSALDEELEQGVMARFIEQARAIGAVVIFVTHSKAIAETYSDRMIDLTPFSYKGGHQDE